MRKTNRVVYSVNDSGGTAMTINDSGTTSAGQNQIVAQERSSLVVNGIFGQDSAVHSINSSIRTEEQEV